VTIPTSRLRLWSEEPSSGSEISFDSDSDNDALALVVGEGRDSYSSRRGKNQALIQIFTYSTFLLMRLLYSDRSFSPLRRPLPPSAAIGYESVRDYLNSGGGGGPPASATSASGTSPQRRFAADAAASASGGRWSRSHESFRASTRERLDIRSGLRRDAERERRRLRRERDISRRRRYER